MTATPATGKPRLSNLEMIRTRGLEFAWQPMPMAIRFVFFLCASTMVFLGALNFMRDDPFAPLFLLAAMAFVALAFFDYLLECILARPNLIVTDRSLQSWRGGALMEEIAWAELVSNSQSYHLKGSVHSIDGKRRIWLYTRSNGAGAVSEQLFQLTDWVSDHRDNVRRADGSITRAISVMLSTAGVLFRPNSPDENGLGLTAVLSASTTLFLPYFPNSTSVWFWFIVVGAVLGVGGALWDLLTYPRRKHECLHIDARGITHTRASGAKMSIAWSELSAPHVRAHWLNARPDSAKGQFRVFDKSGNIRISVGSYIRHVMVLDMIFEDLILSAEAPC